MFNDRQSQSGSADLLTPALINTIKPFEDPLFAVFGNTDSRIFYNQCGKLKVEINILNALIASKNIEKEFADLIKRYPEVLKAIPILLAVREYEIYCQDENGAILYRFDKTIQSVEQYAYLMRQRMQ